VGSAAESQLRLGMELVQLVTIGKRAEVPIISRRRRYRHSAIIENMCSTGKLRSTVRHAVGVLSKNADRNLSTVRIGMLDKLVRSVTSVFVTIFSTRITRGAYGKLFL